MRFTKLVPNIFYKNIKDGLDLFINCLEFSIGCSDFDSGHPCCIVRKDELSIFLFQNKEFADEDRPEIRLHTDNIEDALAKIS